MFYQSQHHSNVLGLRLAITVRVEDSVVDYPEVLGLWVYVDQRDHSDAPDHVFGVARPLIARRLYLGSEALLQHGIVEDQVRIRVALQKFLDLFEEQAGRKLLAPEVAIYGVVAEPIEVLGEVGQSVVDLAREQILAVIQLRKFHALNVARPHCVSPGSFGRRRDRRADLPARARLPR